VDKHLPAEFSADNMAIAARELIAMVHQTTRSLVGHCRCEDAISAVAAFTGETILRRANDFDFENHTFNPGQPVFSQRVTSLLSGDRAAWREIPNKTTFGMLYALLPNHPTHPYSRESFPDVGDIYRRYAMARGRGVSKADWGKVPLSVPAKHFPSEKFPALRAAYEIRCFINKRWDTDSLYPANAAAMAELALLMILLGMRNDIAPEVGLLLALETVNAMAKTAPFLPKHLTQLARLHQEAIVKHVQ
jgi:hypothetical protein